MHARGQNSVYEIYLQTLSIAAGCPAVCLRVL